VLGPEALPAGGKALRSWSVHSMRRLCGGWHTPAVITVLDHEAVRLELRDGLPVVVLDVEVPAGVPDGEWKVMSLATLVAVHGPNQTAFMLSRLAREGDFAPDGWDEAIERVGVCLVFFGAAPGAPGVLAGRIRADIEAQ
jgi:hypothetical protein